MQSSTDKGRGKHLFITFPSEKNLIRSAAVFREKLREFAGEIIVDRGWHDSRLCGFFIEHEGIAGETLGFACLQNNRKRNSRNNVPSLPGEKTKDANAKLFSGCMRSEEKASF